MDPKNKKLNKNSFVRASTLVLQQRKLCEIEQILKNQFINKDINEFLLLMELIEDYRIKFPFGTETYFTNRVRRMMRKYLILLRYYISLTIDNMV